MIEIVEAQAHKVNGLVLIDSTGGVWQTFSRPWWDLASHVWWFLTRRRKMVLLRLPDRKIRVWAVRLAKRHVRIGRPPE